MHRLRDVAPELDVLVISAAREVETVRRALRGGIVHYLIKPFSQTDLQERLEHYRNAYQGLDSSKDVAEQSDVNRVFGLERTEHGPARCRRAAAPRRCSWWSGRCTRPRRTCPPPKSPTCWARPGSAPAATWSTCTTRPGWTSGSSTAPDVPNAATCMKPA